MTEQEVTPEILGVLRSMDLLKGKDPDELTEWLEKLPSRAVRSALSANFPPANGSSPKEVSEIHFTS